MSAFIVTQYHINSILSYATLNDFSVRVKGATIRVRGNEQEIAEILWAENHRSVSYRYAEANLPEPFRFDLLLSARNMQAVECIKLVQCLEYQSCECPDYEQTDAAEICRMIKEEAIYHLPGYSAAKWAVDAPAETHWDRQQAGYCPVGRLHDQTHGTN